MAHFPDFATFSKLATTADYVPVYRRVLSDVLTPVSAFHKIDDGGSACLFESVIGGEKVGRYSFLAAEPFLVMEAHGLRTQLFCPDEALMEHVTSVTAPFLDNDTRLMFFASNVQAIRVAKVPGLPPFTGGAVGYAGYDTVRYVEHLPNAPTDDRELADLSFAFYDHMIVFDNVQKTAIVVALAKVAGELASASSLRCVRRCLSARRSPGREARLAERRPEARRRRHRRRRPRSSTRRTSRRREYEDAVRKCVEYIRAGDIFQVVLSQRLAVPLAVDPFEVYRTLRVVNPARSCSSCGRPSVRSWAVRRRSWSGWWTAR